MGSRSFAVLVGLLLVAACGGSEFSAAGSGGDTTSGGGGAAGHTPGSSGSAGTAIGAAGSAGTAAGSSDASLAGGSGGQALIEAGPHADVSSGSGGAAVVDASTDTGPRDTGGMPRCPPMEPDLTAPCGDGLKCTYGSHPRLACRKSFTCTSGHWAIAPMVACGELAMCITEMPLPVINKTCSTTGHDCAWDTGLYCRCLACPDANCPKWDCFPPPPKCGTTPPNLGQPCDPNTLPSCDYGACTLGTRVITTCVNGVTNWTFPNCQ